MIKLSLIIPTRNRSTLLANALNSVLYQTLAQSHFEVIVVDNGSSDDTFNVVDSFRAKLKNIRYFYEPSPGLHVGRHKGLIEAESDLLVYADDDIEAFPTWLQAIQDSFDNKDVVMVGGKCLPKFETEPPDWLRTMWLPNSAGEHKLGYLSVIDSGDQAKFVTPHNIYGCNFSVRRSLLLEAGGFHPDGMPQQFIRFRGDGETHVSEYVKTRGYLSLYNPLASIYHLVPENRMTIEYFCQRAYNQGISDSYSAIRCARGIYPEVKLTGQITVKQMLIKSVLGVAKSISRISECLDLSVNTQKSLERKIYELRRNFASAHQSGFDYHQAQVRESPELLSWVLKPDYWSCQLPCMSSGED